MNGKYITDLAKLIEQLSRFTTFIHHMDGCTGFLSFRDSSSFLGREEDYKSIIAENARNELKFADWKESWIGSREIAARAAKAMGKAGNLVNKNQQIDFKNRLNPEHPKYCPEAEQVLYDIYCNNLCPDSVAFNKAVSVFGAKYDTIAFLFFIKDDTRFLPISTSHFDESFKILNINYSTSYKCSWENYIEFISIIMEIRSVMEDILPMQGVPRLIDAHSFVWIIQEERFQKYAPDVIQESKVEETIEDYMQNAVSGTGGQRKSISNVYIRSAEVVKETKKRANGVCQYCGQPAPFIDNTGTPYLEVHHVIWLSRGGEDSTANTVALCPNCHKRMHILDRQEDTTKLQKTIIGCLNNCRK